MMKRYLRKLSIIHYPLFISAVLLVACSEDITTQTVMVEEGMPINIASTYPVASNTRAAIDNGFVADDAVGIFVVDYDKEGNPGTLALNGNRGNNVKFAYDGSQWTANYQMYWAAGHTPADFYGYYPFDQSMQSVTEYTFAVSRRQDSDATTTGSAGYEASDLLWAKTENVSPTTETINLQYKHLMAGVTVTLEMGTGFETSEWAGLDKTVQIENTILGGSVDLSKGTTTVSDDAKSVAITPLLYNNTWRAVVFPQTVAAKKVIASVTVDNQIYQLKKDASVTYQSGKMHNITITVNKRTDTGDYEFVLTADDIVAWVDDPQLHDGLVRQYTIITLKEAGTLKAEVDKVCRDYGLLRNLKVAGPMNADDRSFIQGNLKALQNVNMLEVEMEDGILNGFYMLTQLQHFVFPAKGIWKIDYHAFEGCALIGSLTIPEGVTELRQCAFWGNKLRGTLTLPSTLKIMEEAFYGNELSGELLLPDGLEEIDGPRGKFSGTLHFPSSVKKVTGLWDYGEVTGTLVIPRCMTEVDGFRDIGCSQVEFHDGVKEIKEIAFRSVPLSGELVLPSNLTKLGVCSFQNTKISHVVFNDRLRIVDNGAFEGCKYLTGTQRFAENVPRVSAECFRGCSALTGIVLPKNVELIEDKAFYECYSLNSIVSENPEPPVVRGDAFLGVPKDNFTVEVPKGSVEKYREAPGWKEFKRIAEYSNFVCRPMQANALNNAHTEKLVLNADGAWQVDRCPEWVTLSKTSGTGKAELTLTFKQMAHGSGNRSDSIIFKMPSENYRTFCVVSQYDYEQEEDSYIALQTHSKGRGIDVVFIGDGYDGEDISNGNYLNLVKQQTEHFFDLEPYKSHRDYFNVYVTFPLSQEKGVNTMNTYVDNHFGTLYGYDGQMCTSNQLLTEVDEVRDYAVAHSPLKQDDLWRSLIILVPNSDAYSGVTYYEWYGSPISICPASNRPYPQDTRGVIQHEAGGHGFGRLGDEEIIYSAWAPASVKGLIEEKHGNGEYANLATTSGLHSVPWADFIFDIRYSDYVDVYEGGCSYMRGIFRPEQNSCMNYGIPYYNAPSRLSIMRRIFNYAGEEFSMEYFYAHDSKAWGASSKTRAAGEAFGGSSYAGSNQHRMPISVDGKKMGTSVRNILNKIKNKNK